MAHTTPCTCILSMEARIFCIQQITNHLRLLSIMNIRNHHLHQAIIQLEDVALKKSTKEHGYYIVVTSLNKIGEDSCVKHSIFLKSESFESIFLSTTRRQHELIDNIPISSSSVSPDTIDRQKLMPCTRS